MLIGVPKEIKNKENRVSLSPAGVRLLIKQNHTVFIQKEAGAGAGFTDDQYIQAGATLLEDAKTIYEKSEMIVKVKEPLPDEYAFLREDQILFAYLHLAADKRLAQILIERKVTAFAYETIQASNGSLPLLAPMSAVAGRLAPQIGAMFLQCDHGGKGIILGGVTGVGRAKVVIVGGGVVGINATKIAVGLGAQVTVLDTNLQRLEYLSDVFRNEVNFVHSSPEHIEKAVIHADLVIGAALIPGAKTPQLITREMVSKMEPGSVIVDVSADQGGTVENCRMTSHEYPTYVLDGVVHYAVPNIPGSVPRTSTQALTHATLQYVLNLANHGWEKAIQTDPALKKGLNLHHGKITYHQVAQDLELPYEELA